MTGQTDRPGPTTPRAHVVAELKAPEPSTAPAPGSEPADPPRPAPASRTVTPPEVRRLLAAEPPRDPAISHETLSNAYVLDGDQCLLVFSNGTGRLYASRTEMLAAMHAIKPGRVPRSDPTAS